MRKPEDSRGGRIEPPPLTLYVHFPWCLRKCPYCDFNSHAIVGRIPEAAYVDRLLFDLDQEIRTQPPEAPLIALFLGGGTPSLFSPQSIERLLQGIRSRVPFAPEIEITLEANPATADAERFSGYRRSGVNRLSLGIQSLSDRHLKKLGRVHGSREAREAVALAREAGFENLNLDLLFGLPDQDLEEAARDLEQVLALQPDHLSYYQLGIEPGTGFWHRPPALPDPDRTAAMAIRGMERIQDAGLIQYEVSAFARPGHRCRHNLNYWSFGDYLGIGAGAHGKRTDPRTGRIERTRKYRHPRRYLHPTGSPILIETQHPLRESDRILEFALNAFRLKGGFARALFEERTGLPFERIAPRIQEAEARGFLVQEGGRVRPTPRGYLFLDELLTQFASDPPSVAGESARP